MLVIGHRGLKDEFPENTKSAVREAARFVDVVEVDVRPCGSGELVAAHDDQLTEITDGEGCISETDLESLRAETNSSQVPEFRELLESWPDETGLNVDIKGSTSVETVRSMVSAAEIEGPIIISVGISALETFDPNAVDEMVGLSFWRDYVENVERAAERGCEFVHVHHRLCLETDVVTRAHDAGLSVDAWSIDESETTVQLAAIGVDAVTVNNRDAIP